MGDMRLVQLETDSGLYQLAHKSAALDACCWLKGSMGQWICFLPFEQLPASDEIKSI